MTNKDLLTKLVSKTDVIATRIEYMNGEIQEVKADVKDMKEKQRVKDTEQDSRLTALEQFMHTFSDNFMIIQYPSKKKMAAILTLCGVGGSHATGAIDWTKLFG